MTFLDEIIGLKRTRVEAAKAVRDPEMLRDAAFAARDGAVPFRLRSALGRSGVNIIAEFKRASPSKGVINDAVDPGATAREYEAGGACAVSVLTEEDRFGGSLDDLRRVRGAVVLPVLRKDFIFDEFQIYEAAEAGADAVLLIAAMLDDAAIRELHSVAGTLGLDVLVEVHDAEELRRVAGFARIIGVNNRDLHSFRVSLDVSRTLAEIAPAGCLLVAESGISRAEEIAELRGLGYDGFLIGETLMRSGDPRAALGALR